MSGGAQFVREATGLVRELSGFDTLNINVAMCSPLCSLIWPFTWASSMFLGVNIPLAYFVGMFVVAFGGAVVYALWSIAMPRSGGDYVWLSRTFHPSLGFAISWFITFVFVYWYGSNATVLGPWVLGPLLQVWGLSAAASFVESFNGSIIVGSIFIVGCTLLVMLPLRAYTKIFLFLFAATVAGSVIYGGLLLSSSNAMFIGAFNNAVQGTNYQDVIQTAASSGWVSGWTTKATLGALFFPIIQFGWGGFPAYMGGEIRRVQRSAWIGMVGAIFFMGIWYVIMGQLLNQTVGSDFLSALTWLYTNKPTAYPLPYAPYPQNYALMLTSNPIILSAIGIGFLLSVVYITPPNLLLASRNVFAWSFDRLVPTKLSEVSQRFPVPIYSVLSCAVLAEIMMILTAFTSFQVIGANVGMMLEVVLAVVGIASIVTPYAKKAMFDSFPEPAKKRLFGVPLLVISGAILAISSSYVVYSTAIAPALGGLNFFSLVFCIALLLVPLPIFLASYLYNKRKGIDMLLLFKEVPPE